MKKTKHLGFKQVSNDGTGDDFEIRPMTNPPGFSLFRKEFNGEWEEITNPQQFLAYLVAFVTGAVKSNLSK